MSDDNHGGAQPTNEAIMAFIAEKAFNVSGVYGMGMNRSAAAITKNILGQDKKTRGVRVAYEEETGYIIDIYLIAVYGVNIPETAWNVQKSVHDGLENEWGIEPSDINIHVQGVYEEREYAKTEI